MGKMSMRVGNRLNSTIVRARMKRIAKTKTFTTKTAENTKEHFREFRTVDQSASFKIKCKQWKDVICGAVTCKPAQTLLYSGMETAAERVEKRLGKVFKNGWYFRI